MRKTATPKEVVKFLEHNGFACARQRGSHALYRHADGRATVVPMHNRDLPTGTLHKICKQAQLDIDNL